MGNIRVHEVAKELGLSSSEIIERLKSLHIDVSSHQSTIEETDVIKLKAFIKVSMSTSAPTPPPEKPKPAPKPKKAKAEEAKPKKKTTKKAAAKPKAAAKKEKPAEDKKEAKPKKDTKKEAEPKKKTATKKDDKKPEAAKKKEKEEVKKEAVKVLRKDEPPKKEDTKADEKTQPKKRTKTSPVSAKTKAADQPEESFFKIEEEDHQEDLSSTEGRSSLPTAADIIREQDQRPRMLKVKKIKRRKVVPPSAEGGKTASQRKKASATPTADKDQIVTLSEGVTVKELSDKLGMRVKDVMKKLMELGYFMNINQALEKELAVQVAEELGYVAEIVSFEEEMTLQIDESHEPEIVEKAPVVTVMGHVDHGKTSLMDVIRKENVVDSEHGGITQHIGAYKVPYKERQVVFLDTPGHEAFTKMRARGAKVTDIVILVVAADDGIKQQTVEAIDHSKAANVPIIVAINKIDKPEANVERVKQQLTEHDLIPEEWGGKTVVCEVSAKKQTGIDNLMEMIFLTTDMLELKADVKRMGQGYIIEAKKDPGKGNIATVLINDGFVEIGSPFIAGAVSGKIRSMVNDLGERIEHAQAAIPVEITGLQDLPQAGDKFQVMKDEVEARKIRSFRQQKMRDSSLARPAKISLDQLFEKISEGELKEVNIILKADVQGSAEVLASSLSELGTAEVSIKVLRSSVGAISENDVLLATASDAIIIGFNIRPKPSAVKLAKKEGVDIRLHTVIYEVINEVREAMEHKLEPTFKEEQKGRAEVRELFKLPKGKVIAGCYVLDGNIARKDHVRLLRDDIVIHTGKLSSLRRFKDDVSEVKKEFECGMGLEDFNDVKVGDVIEAFEIIEVASKLS